MVSQSLRDGRLVRVLPQWHGGVLQIYAAMPSRKHVPTRTRAFMDFLVEVFGGTQDDPWLEALESSPGVAPSGARGRKDRRC